MEAYMTSIHIKQLRCAIQHYWFQVYTCLFWIASTVFIHNWEIKEKQLEMMMMKKDKLSCHNVFPTMTVIEEDQEGEEEYQDDDDDDSCCFSDDDEEESDSDDETIVTTTLSPWTKEKEKEYETQTLHSFDTNKSESKSNIKRKMSSIKHQVTAWKQKHFHEKSKFVFSKKKQNILATFRRKTSPDIYI